MLGKSFLLLCINLPTLGMAQVELEKKIPLNVVTLAKELMRQNVQHWQVVLAQGITETGWDFDSEVCRNANNFIGMRIARGRPTTRTGTYHGYSSYDTWQDCVRDIKLWQKHYWDGGGRMDYINLMHRVWATSPDYRLFLIVLSEQISRALDKFINSHKFHFNNFILYCYLKYYKYQEP